MQGGVLCGAERVVSLNVYGDEIMSSVMCY